jgi:hypothetical protein
VLVSVLGLGASALGDRAANQVRDDLRRGGHDLQSGLGLLLAAGSDADLTDQAGLRFQSARTHFHSVAALARTAGWMRSGVGLEEVPGVGAQLRAMDRLAQMGLALSALGMEAAELRRNLPRGDETRLAAHVLDEAPKAITRLRPLLVKAAAAAAEVDLKPGWMPADDSAAFTRLRAGLQSVLALIDQLESSLPGLRDLLGMNGRRVYLVEEVNPAELRSGGGFIGSVALVSAERGLVTLEQSLPVEAFDLCDADACVHRRPSPWNPLYVAPPRALTDPRLPRQMRLASWSLEDSNFHPDFESNARLAADFTTSLLGTRVDGVVAIDYEAVAGLLRVTGPVELPHRGVRFDADTFVAQVLKLDFDRDPDHKLVLGEAAGPLLQKLTRLSISRWPELWAALDQMVRRRQVQAHAGSPQVQVLFASLGLRSGLGAGSGLGQEFLMETEDNYGGSKANAFVKRSFELTLTGSGDRLHHHLVVDIANHAPPPTDWLGTHYYSYVRLYAPDVGSRIQISSAPSREYPPVMRPLLPEPAPQGLSAAAGWIFIDTGPDLSGRYRLIFDYDTVWNAQASRPHLIFWQKQPGTGADTISVRWRNARGSWRATGDLSEDRVLSLSSDGVELAPSRPPAPQPKLPF